MGIVQIDDDVEIGANCTIDRAALGKTWIQQGTKIDNQVQIGHNVRIGEHTVVAGCVGISGSAVIGRRCMLGGMVGVAGHLEICDDVLVTGRTMVSSSIRQPACTRARCSGRFGVSAATPRDSRSSTSSRGVRRLERRGRRTRGDDGMDESSDSASTVLPFAGRLCSSARGRALVASRTSRRTKSFQRPSGSAGHARVMVLEALAQAAAFLLRHRGILPGPDRAFLFRRDRQGAPGDRRAR
jgi:carbonic anhydrase/acetyltransferase-like protein (isoleucine patch superfamily)